LLPIILLLLVIFFVRAKCRKIVSNNLFFLKNNFSKNILR